MIIVETITGGVASRPHWNCSVVSFSRCMWPCVYKQRRVYVPPLFLVSRESMHNPPTMQSTFGLSPSLSLTHTHTHTNAHRHSVFLPLLSLFPQFILVSSARLFFISKILSIRANKLCSALNSQARIYGKKDKAIFGLDCQWERMDRRVITDSLTFAVRLLPVVYAIGTYVGRTRMGQGGGLRELES